MKIPLVLRIRADRDRGGGDDGVGGGGQRGEDEEVRGFHVGNSER